MLDYRTVKYASEVLGPLYKQCSCDVNMISCIYFPLLKDINNKSGTVAEWSKALH